MPALLPEALGLVAPLTAGMREALPFIGPMVNSGLSANGIIRLLRATGHHVRDSQAKVVIRVARSNKPRRAYVKNVRLDATLDYNRFENPLTVQRRALRYVVDVEGTSLVTGKKMHQFVTVSTNTLLTKRQAMHEAEDTAALNVDTYHVDVTGSVVDKVTRAHNLEVLHELNGIVTFTGGYEPDA